MEWFYPGVGFVLPIALSIMYSVFDTDRPFCMSMVTIRIFVGSIRPLQFGLKIGYFFGPLWLLFFLEMSWAYQTYHKLKEVGL